MRIKTGLAVISVIALSSTWLVGEPESATIKKPKETELDLPGSYVRYFDYGERVNAWRARYGLEISEHPDYALNSPGARYERLDDELQKNTERRLSRLVKLDLDGDMNYDGVIDNADPADGGYYETTPPGLVLGQGEMTKLIIRFRLMNRKKLGDPITEHGSVVVTAEVVGINRGIRSGLFTDFKKEQESVSRIRVWRDKDKKELLLDSGVETKRFFEWTEYDRTYQGNMPWGIPRTVYVEGVSASKEFSGDIRLLFSVSFRESYRCCDSDFSRYGKEVKNENQEGWPKDKRELKSSFVIHGDQVEEVTGKTSESLPSKQTDKQERFISYNRGFRAAYDHVLFTVYPKAHKKEFIKNNLEAVWLRANGKSQ